MSSFTLNIFNELKKKYSSWNDLKSYLESEEGGYIRVVSEDSENGLCILKYDKQFSKPISSDSSSSGSSSDSSSSGSSSGSSSDSSSSDSSASEFGWFRSVVWDTLRNIPVCVAPPKASDLDLDLQQRFSDFNQNGKYYCQEFVEGFMINCFRLQGSEKIHIVSRSCFDATGRFYSTKTFKELFTEAVKTRMNDDADDAIAVNSDSSDEYLLNTYLSKYIAKPDADKGELAHFSSFVVYHPQHRIVTQRYTPGFREVHSGIVFADGKVEMSDRMDIPQIADLMTVSESDDGTLTVQDYIQNYMSKKDWEFQGIIIKDLTGNRWRVKNEKYTMVKSLRGNSASFMNRFVLMYQQNLIKKYFEYYPEDTVRFGVCHMSLLTLISKLMTHYRDLYIRHSVRREEIDKMYLPHLYNLHGYYLSHIKPTGGHLTENDIHLYFHKQPWQRIVFLINKYLSELRININDLVN